MLSLGFDPGTPPSVRARVGLVLVVAIAAISSSAVLVRAMAAPALAIAAWRTLGAAALLAIPAARGVAGLRRGDLARVVGAGLALGLHFWAWFASVQLTTILRSTLLVALVPAWTALLEWLAHGVRPRAAHWAGLGIALPGLGLLAGGGEGSATLLGDALATAAGGLWAIYFLIGREVRQRVQVSTFMGLACAAAAATLFPAAALLDTPLTGWPLATWALIAAAILGPQLLGHQGFAYAVRWLPASTISSLMLLEPVGAALLAAAVFGEVPSALGLAGAALVLSGISLANWSRRNPSGDEHT